MTDPTTPSPASVLAAAREAVELAAKATPGPWTYDGLGVGVFAWEGDHIVADVSHPSKDAPLIAHAGTHYGAIAAALLAAHERETALRAEVVALAVAASRAKEMLRALDEACRDRDKEYAEERQDMTIAEAVAALANALRAPALDTDQDGA